MHDNTDAPVDADLHAVIEVWPDLPEPIKAAVLALVRTATPDATKRRKGRGE